MARFGFELEMLTPEDAEGAAVEVERDCYCGNNCCSGSYTEVDYSEGSERYFDLLTLMDARGLAPGLACCYHCDCDGCDPERTRGRFLATQQDCTVGVEFISRICDVGRPEDVESIGSVVEVLSDYYRWGRWVPNGSDSDGNHVHVSWSGTDNDGPRYRGSSKRLAHALVNGAYAAFDGWERAADGGCGRLRGYNSKPHGRTHPVVSPDFSPFVGGWVAAKNGYGFEDSATLEHRVWNTPAVPERIFGHIGVSLAMTRWALATATVNVVLREKLAAMTGTQLVDEFVALGPTAWSEQVAMYLPTGPEWEAPCRTILSSLAS